jgi:hypothetical protein
VDIIIRSAKRPLLGGFGLVPKSDVGCHQNHYFCAEIYPFYQLANDQSLDASLYSKGQLISKGPFADFT